MRGGTLTSFGFAIAAHVAVLFLGGLLLFHPKHVAPTVTREVALFGDTRPEEKKSDEQEKKAVDEDLAAQGEQLPDSSLLAKAPTPVNVGDAGLEALSLSELESALNPNIAAATEGGFSEAVRLTSGGRIGGMGTAGGRDTIDALFSIADLDQKPRPLFQTQPRYPSDLRKKGLEGTVYIVFVVDPQGRVANPRVERSTHPGFEGPALEAVRQWRFEAGLKNGQKVSFKMRIPITFSKG